MQLRKRRWDNVDMEEKTIDFVIAWVDGADPEWLMERKKYAPDGVQDASSARYRDWENLKYWFRAVERYAPWVRKVHFVTWGHMPAWLNDENEKLHIVRHQDFIPQKFLPTFNSHTIELNLHRIFGLSEQFVYFNDDMFLNQPICPDSFFCAGKPRDEFILDAVYFSPTSAGAYNGNNLEIINQHFNLKRSVQHMGASRAFCMNYGKRAVFMNLMYAKRAWFPGFRYNHLATSILKDTMYEVWEKERETLERTCMDKFRSKRNVNQWVFKYWQLASGNFIPRSPSIGKAFHLRKQSDVEAACCAITNPVHSMICINDTPELMDADFAWAKSKIADCFESMLFQKSSFEK